jgi:thiamine-phosphate pyrophosphorylase
MKLSMTEIYAITPPSFALDSFLPEAEAALQTGKVACLQLRLKEAEEAFVMEAAKALLPLCHRYEVPLMVNDSIEVAIQCGADGMHLGQEDLAGTSVKAVRKQLPKEMVLGITCHASSHLAMEAGEQGADYVAFGAFYETTSKPKEKLEKWGTPSLELIENWVEFSTLPCVAIGGIKPENCAPLVQARADFIAVITGIWSHPEGAAAGVEAYHSAIERSLAERASA